MKKKVYSGLTLDAGVDVHIRSFGAEYGSPLHPYLNTLGAVFFFFKQKTAYEIQGDWSSDVCSSDLIDLRFEDTTPKGDGCQVMGDETRLQQIVINLCANASHAMKARGGVVVVRAGRELDGMFVMDVVDEGEGIPEDIRGRLF